MNRLDLVELDGLSVLSYISDTSPEFVCSDTRSRMLAEKVASNKIDIRPDCSTEYFFDLPFSGVSSSCDAASSGLPPRKPRAAQVI